MDVYYKITSSALTVEVLIISVNLKQQTLTPPNRPSLLSVSGINYSSEVDNIEAPLCDGKLGISTFYDISDLRLIESSMTPEAITHVFVKSKFSNGKIILEE